MDDIIALPAVTSSSLFLGSPRITECYLESRKASINATVSENSGNLSNLPHYNSKLNLQKTSDFPMGILQFSDSTYCSSEDGSLVNFKCLSVKSKVSSQVSNKSSEHADINAENSSKISMSTGTSKHTPEISEYSPFSF